MTISYQWLSEYLPFSLPPGDLAGVLTAIGLEVEGLEQAETIKGGLEGLVVGEVLTCEKHPNADKLSLTKVSVGEGAPLSIVCGAPNVAAGQKVVVAVVGTTVHPSHGDPFLIKKAKIRGADSEGMLCAEDEIGLGDSHAGIIVLPATAPVGMSARDYYGIQPADTAIHIGLTPNRSDANSHIGVARDVCAWYTHHKGTEAKPMLPLLPEVPVDGQEPLSVTVAVPEACPRYAGVAVSGVTVGESPEWLKQRLQTIGVRPVNNIVDITNYVLHEYGQPLHAFDADRLRGGITVKFLPEGTPFTALDGKVRQLRSEDIVICDEGGSVALGGVSGGKESGISDTTTNIFIESAWFTPVYIRRTSLHHGLRTDAATHFEKGVDSNMILPALLRAAGLAAQIAGGRISSAITDVYPVPLTVQPVITSYGFINKLAGKVYSPAAVDTILNALGFDVAQDGNKLVVTPPTNKTDITQPADVVEEVLRIDGLDNIPLPGRMTLPFTHTTPDNRELREYLAGLLCGAGLSEIVTNSIVNSKYYPERNDLVRMLNSLSADLDVMRPSMLESGLEVIQYNCNRKQTDLQLFEFGNVYADAGTGFRQEHMLAVWFTGNRLPAHWNGKEQKADYSSLKGLLTALFNGLKINNLSEKPGDGTQTVWLWNGQEAAKLAQVPEATLKAFDIRQEVFFASISFDVLANAVSSSGIRYAEVAKFPSVSRDLAIVVDKSVTYAQVKAATETLNLPALLSFSLFDVFESEKLGAGKKSLALNFTFQLHDRTLTDAETEQLMNQLSGAYSRQLNAQIR